MSADPTTLGAALQAALGTPPRWSVAVAESLTSGHLQTRIAAVSGASRYFRGGLTAYTLEQKVRHLGVDRTAAEAVDCVSAAVAAQMARGASALFGADLALATTGYAEVAAGEVPHAYWALAAGPLVLGPVVAARGPAGGAMVVREGRVAGAGLMRIAMQEHVADVALAALVAFLREVHGGSPR